MIRDIVVFDTETTSEKPEEARIVELGIILRSGGQHRTKRWIVNPGVPIPPDTVKIHGIDDRRVADAPRLEDVAGEVLRMLSAAPTIVAYNGRTYDGPLIIAELERIGFKAHGIEVDRILDPLVFVRWHLRHLRDRTMAGVCEHLRVRTGTMHSAVYDCAATIGVIDALDARGWIPPDPATALADQRDKATVCDAEFDRWSWWLYADRGPSARLTLGCGKHCGVLLDDVPTGYLHWAIRNIEDLPPLVREEFQRCITARSSGRRRFS